MKQTIFQLSTPGGAVLAAVAVLLGAGCDIRRNMYDQPKFEPYEATEFFPDGRSARPRVEHTVAREYLYEDDHLYRGKVDGKFVDTFPYPVTREVLARGQGRFNIYCTPCHDRAGTGNGMIVKRGFKPPPSYHNVDLRENPDKPVGYLYDVISNGFGVMSGYGYQLNPEDRWAVVAYVRALQFSQYIDPSDLSAEDQQKLQAAVQE